MGAWGYGLFQSDHDYEIVDEFTKDIGLVELEKKIKGTNYSTPPPLPNFDMVWAADLGRARYVGRQSTQNAVNGGKPEAERHLNYCMYAPFCSDPETVRKHVDSGRLATMLAEKENKMFSADAKVKASASRAGDGYDYILLGACAMSLGCKIPEHHKSVMRKVYTSVGFLQEGVEQMSKALNGPKPYQDGKPYDFGSLDLHNAMKLANITRQPNDAGVIGMNAPGPGTIFYAPPHGATDEFNELRAKFAELSFGPDACNRCGAKQSKDGAALLTCSRCRERKYCSIQCQKEHWKAGHKSFCKAASTTDKENVKPENGGEKAKSDKKAWTV